MSTLKDTKKYMKLSPNWDQEWPSWGQVEPKKRQLADFVVRVPPQQPSDFGPSWRHSGPSWGQVGPTWPQDGAKLVGSGAIGASLQGISVKLNGDGTVVAIGGAGHDTNQGAMWIFTKTLGMWSETAMYTSTGYTSEFYGISVTMAPDANQYYVGASRTESNTGAVSHIIPGSVPSSGTYTTVLPSRAYSIFDIVNTLTTLMDYGDVSYVATFDNPTFTITADTGGNVANHLFKVNAELSTFDVVDFKEADYAATQSSTDIDFSIGNDVIGTVSTREDNSDNVMFMQRGNETFRKFAPGYTIDIEDKIDIQLRDERDRIVDLNGSDWAVTIYCGVQA